MVRDEWQTIYTTKMAENEGAIGAVTENNANSTVDSGSQSGENNQNGQVKFFFLYYGLLFNID